MANRTKSTSTWFSAQSGKVGSRQNADTMMTEPAQLSDEDLLDRAHQLRLLALRGHRDSRRPAHEHEHEVRRRFGIGDTSICAPLEPERCLVSDLAPTGEGAIGSRVTVPCVPT